MHEQDLATAVEEATMRSGLQKLFCSGCASFKPIAKAISDKNLLFISDKIPTFRYLKFSNVLILPA